MSVGILGSQFDTRQYMSRKDYEFFHYRDPYTLEVEFHNHDFFELYFLIKGDVTYIVEGRSYTLKPWDVLLIGSNEIHRPVNHTPPGEVYERYVLWIDQSFLAKNCDGETDLLLWHNDASLKKHSLLRIAPDQLQTLISILSRLEDSYNGFSYGSSVLSSIYILELIVFLTRKLLRTSDKHTETALDKDISQIIDYINSHLSEDLSLDCLANRFYLNKFTLLRNFKTHTGCTLYRYIQIKRLSHAKTLLLDGVSVTEACGNSGFSDYSNFIRMFKKEFGMPPLKYVKTFYR